MPLTPIEQDARWFAEEVQPHEPALRAYLHGRFPRLRDVDDLVQEAYARLFRARATGRVREPRAFLFVTARNAALDFFRRHRAGPVEESSLLRVVAEGPDAAEAASHANDLALLHQAIAALPRRCRAVLVLRRFSGLTYREIAVRLAISENTVNAQLAVALLRCRAHLRAHGALSHLPHEQPPAE